MATAQRIRKMISETMCDDDILLVLISGKVLYTENKERTFFVFVRYDFHSCTT